MHVVTHHHNCTICNNQCFSGEMSQYLKNYINPIALRMANNVLSAIGLTGTSVTFLLDLLHQTTFKYLDWLVSKAAGSED